MLYKQNVRKWERLEFPNIKKGDNKDDVTSSVTHWLLYSAN